ncbi:hypothetical protein KAR91_75075 [Candidatus Pacearchaeota archaeon]|nr:hypothetical protein [Candidatus Pacearchaeota archaeon]
MKLLFRKNRRIDYEKPSGKTCPGFDKCLYPGSVIHSTIQEFKDDPKISYPSCRYRQYVGPIIEHSAVPLQNFTRAEFEEKYIKKFTLCKHPSELSSVTEWRCYKCNATVGSERERHRCS